MNKMSLERFREIRERIKWMMALKVGDTDLTEEELITEYNSLLNELLSSDLSDIRGVSENFKRIAQNLNLRYVRHTQEGHVEPQ